MLPYLKLYKSEIARFAILVKVKRCLFYLSILAIFAACLHPTKLLYSTLTAP